MSAAQVLRTCAARRLVVATMVAIAAVGIVLLAPAAPANAADLVSLVGGTTRTLHGDEANPSVRFPIEFTEVGAEGSVQVSVTEVLRDTVVLAEEAVQASVDTAGMALVLAVADDMAFAPAADYSVTVLLADGAANRQSVTVTLRRPAAKIASGGVVEVEEFVGWLSGWNEDVTPQLEVSVERGGAIRSLTARQIERSEGQVAVSAACVLADDTTGTCELASAHPVTLAPAAVGDGVLVLEYDPSGFPLGTTVRTVELRSPQLDAPVPMTFEVTERRSPFLIPVIAVLGLIAGIVVRVGLVRAIAWSTRKSAKAQLRRVIDGLRETYADVDFRESLDGIVAVLNDKKLTTEQIVAQVKAVADELESLNGALVEVREAVDAIADAIAGSWTLPDALRDRVMAVKQAVSGVRAQLDARDLATARQHLVVAEIELEGTRDEAVDWAGNYRAAVAAATAEVKDLKGSWSVSRLAHVFADSDRRAEIVADAGARAALATVHSVTRDWNRDVEPAIRSAIADRAHRNPALAQQVLRALRGGDAVQRLGAASEPLGQLLRTPQPPARGAGSLTQESARAVAEGVGLAQEAGADATVLLPVYDMGLLGHVRRLPTRIAASTIGWGARALLFLSLSSIIAFVAYSIGADEWVGETPQMAALFGWAFVIDVSVASTIALFGQQQSTPLTFAQE